MNMKSLMLAERMFSSIHGLKGTLFHHEISNLGFELDNLEYKGEAKACLLDGSIFGANYEGRVCKKILFIAMNNGANNFFNDSIEGKLRFINIPTLNLKFLHTILEFGYDTDVRIQINASIIAAAYLENKESCSFDGIVYMPVIAMLGDSLTMLTIQMDEVFFKSYEILKMQCTADWVEKTNAWTKIELLRMKAEYIYQFDEGVYPKYGALHSDEKGEYIRLWTSEDIFNH